MDSTGFAVCPVQRSECWWCHDRRYGIRSLRTLATCTPTFRQYRAVLRTRRHGPPLSTGLAALGAALLSLAQRRLSTPVRALRRRAVAVTGLISYRDGSTQPIDAPTLIAVPEGALRLLWPAAVLMSAGVLGARWL